MLSRACRTHIILFVFENNHPECLIELADDLKRQNKVLLLARVKDPIRRLLLKLEQFQDKLFWSVNDAVVDAKKCVVKSF